MQSSSELPEPHGSPPPEQGDSLASWYMLWRRIRGITPSVVLRLALVLCGLWVVGWVLMFSWAALLPFQIGVVLAYLLLPLVNILEKYIPRWSAILSIFMVGLVLLLAVIGLIVPLLVNQASEAVSNIPNVEDPREQIDKIMTTFESYIATLPSDLRDQFDAAWVSLLTTIRENFTIYVQTVIGFLMSSVFGLINTFTFVFGFLVIPFWLFYVLNDHKAGVRAVDALLPPWMRADFWAILRIIDRIVSSYLRGQIFLATVVAVASFMGLSLLQMFGVEGVQYKLLLAVIAGMMEFIPFIGPILGAIPAIIVGLFHSWETALAITLLYIVIQQLESNLLVPRVVGDSVSIHPGMLMFLLVVFSTFGFIWIVLAAPLAAVIRDIYWYVYGRVSYPPRPAGLLPREELPAPAEAPSPPAPPVIETQQATPDQPAP